jgi:hypothetical protein
MKANWKSELDRTIGMLSHRSDVCDCHGLGDDRSLMVLTKSGQTSLMREDEL